MPREYVLLYLIYGFSFIAMGLAAFQYAADERITNLHLARTLPDLGFFGVIHGITEWMTMMMATGLFPEMLPEIIPLRSFLKVISFAYLMRFGMRVYWRHRGLRDRVFWIPWVLAVVWAAAYLLMVLPSGTFRSDNISLLNTFLMRYAMGVPGGVLTFLAFWRDASLFQKTNRPQLATNTRNLAVVFLLYGLLDGFVVRGAGFFPANVINHNAFRSLTGIPVQVLKAVAGISILWWVSRLVRAYQEDAQKNLHQMLQEQATNDERRRIGMTLHDGIIQKLYASGLKVEYLVKKNDPTHQDDTQKNLLIDVRDGLNESIQLVREVLNQEAQELIDPEQLKMRLQELVEDYRAMSPLCISLESRIPPLQFGRITPEQATHVYYIVQEALCNTLRHANADQIAIILDSRLEGMAVSIEDNGSGIPRGVSARYEGKGLVLMRQRAMEAGGELDIPQKGKGTTIILVIPWKE